ncbi:type II toxin-antitoxin system RatA family toxin [Telmatospirillum sp.]|uniref:type II toxin-antitoxin system RatA family toxin n=1 Tax=Telmatospirillum sp. TaxID=2079197 RepID=UPI00284C57B3|nr:type II toxin-antitoxin system RatA family toxin [Telmatospirillum sp.]MDR3441129.1 type II toxin-antitoxin system RatA family toxin [Telmatospirillum sp.]
MDHKAPSGGAVSGGWELFFPRYTPAQLFALASDIESYPFFVPGCVAARIVERRDNLWRVENVFSFGPVRHRFVSQAELNPPEGLEIKSSDGPWKNFLLLWQFAPQEQGCKLACRFSAEFRSGVLGAIASLGQHGAERRIMTAFERRAKALYG